MAKKKKKSKPPKKKKAEKKPKKKPTAEPKKKPAAKKVSFKGAKTRKSPSAPPVPKGTEQEVQSALEEVQLGEVEDYFGKIGVIALTLKDAICVGDSINVRGHTTNYTQKVASMQIEHASVQEAKKGDSIGIKVGQKSRKGDKVFKLI